VAVRDGRNDGGSRLEGDRRYVPALGFHWLTPLYDPIVALTTRERTFRRALLRGAGIGPGARVLDLGCGTGTLAIWAKQAHPSALLAGIDGDPGILARARRKAERVGVEIRFDEGLSFDLPYAADSFDHVLSSLFFHHLDRVSKLRSLAEALRVLRPGGRLHVADWGEASSGWMRALFFSVQLLDGFENTRDHVAGRFSGLLADSGFGSVQESDRFATVLGTLSIYRAVVP
jgi:ubiquinone/menaquinone biosynthesis C-methylase UbiE